ncbi:hypothetical protein [Halorussus halobius]|uniref:hypothetical protein n=1 Tax=Halorussus halobius TaxID=1710537 RepID=UPI0010926219|nr:hypothetical protein [Halorussus halobius]
MSTHPTFAPLPEHAGLDVVDPIETRHFSLYTDAPVDPSGGDVDRFAFPVATACEIRCGRIALPYMVPMEVRTPDGDHRTSVDLPTVREFPADEYLLELHSPIKLYLRVTGGMSVDTTGDEVGIEFDGTVAVEVGARSYHSAPAATVTVPDDPEAMMTAVSTFGSALKTASPERAWPTLRGHPPEIARGDELSVPDGLDAPDTGVTVSIPAEYGHVYAVAPLAYYLGADVVPGETARLTAASGVDRSLGADVRAVGESVESLLKRVFFLDCVVRTEGLYPDDLHERDVLESRVDRDLAGLYDAPPADRLAAYLSVSDEAVAAIESPWHRVTHVRPDPETVELLPYVVNDLSLVAVEPADRDPWSPTESQRKTGDVVDSFVRSASAGGDDFLRSARPRGSFRRSGELEGEPEQSGRDRPGDHESSDDGSADSARGVPGEGGYIPLPDVDALEQAWVGDRTPIEGTKLLKPAFEHDRTTSEDGRVEITVVCNDEEMREELDSTAEIYGTREDLRTEVTCEFGVTTAELRDLLARDSDMFHFIGHIDGLGFQCVDGILDAGTLDATGAKTVLLNGCRSHDQGAELVAAGARAAVVSLADLWNSGAMEVGETLARLFHHGFSIGHAMTIVREYTSLGGDYVVLGDPGVTLSQCENGIPTMYHVDPNPQNPTNSDEIRITSYSYPIRSYNIGSTVRLYVPGSKYQHVATGTGVETEVPMNSFRELFTSTPEPIIVGNELTWTDVWL